jgi:hypothetical protein
LPRLLASAFLLVTLTLTIGSEARGAAGHPSVARIAISSPHQLIVSGVTAFTARVTGPAVHEVVFKIDGQHRWATVRRPYRYVVNTRRLRDGTHVLTIQALVGGHRWRRMLKRIVVRNRVTRHPVPAAVKTIEPAPSTAALAPAPTGPAPAGPPPASSPPASTPASTPPASPPSSMIWNGDLSTGDLSQYGYVQGCPGPNPVQGVSVVNSPVHPGWQHSVQFTVSDQSISANCPILGSPGHPNANLLTPALFKPGDDDYIGFSTFFPAGFPQVCAPWVPGCFMQVAEIYGPPFGGASPACILEFGNQLIMNTHTSGTIWRSPTPIPFGTGWNDIVLHINFSTDPTVGFVELYYDGQLQTFSNGSTRFYEATLAPGVNWDGVHPDTFDLQQYRGNNPVMGTTTLYQTGAKVASTYAAAAP